MIEDWGWEDTENISAFWGLSGSELLRTDTYIVRIEVAKILAPEYNFAVDIDTLRALIKRNLPEPNYKEVKDFCEQVKSEYHSFLLWYKKTKKEPNKF